MEECIEGYLCNRQDWTAMYQSEGSKQIIYFAIDVKSRRDAWRIILEPLDENQNPYNPCNIDEIAEVVRIVEIMEVSKHYE